ncbi:sigma 54-interacting transcriptional regulator [Candidatus Poribacteria bacterium]|nr:sigma 54-interacting transcriptional regulator [Candidatus Poribacteria bacterium]
MSEKTTVPKYGVTRHVISESAQMQAVFQYAQQVAPTKATVLITGETGVGKEIIAQTIHDNSPRKAGPYKIVNCGGVPSDLIQSELFGHEKGAFTNAIRERPGIFKQAHGGTLFLDEVGDLPLEVQANFLRVLEQQEFSPVGGEKTVKVDVRVISATNVNLKTAVNEKKFREDLYYRLNLFRIQVPPLRNRRSDIPPLACDFVSQLSKAHNKVITDVTPEALNYLQNADWHGNIRELRNTIETAIILAESEELGEQDIRIAVENLKDPDAPSQEQTDLSNSAAVEAEILKAPDLTPPTRLENAKDRLWELARLGTLPDITAYISLLRYEAENLYRSKKEIAQQLKISIPTLNKYCAYAKTVLQKRWNKQSDGN